MHTFTPLPRTLRAGARSVGLAASIVASFVAPSAAEYATPIPPLDTPPTLLMRIDAVRAPSAVPTTLRIPILLDEPARLDITARGMTGRTRTVTDVRPAGRTIMVIPVHRRARLIRAFDRHRAARLALQVVATDADGDRGILATTIRIRAPRGYVPSTRMLSPMPGFAVTSGFGPRWGRNHSGIDIPAPTGTTIRAARAGVVTSVGYDGGYGLTTVVDHGPYETWYAHQSDARVRVGQQVARGRPIGSVGTSGSVTGAHLHFEVHAGGTAVDPMRYLR